MKYQTIKQNQCFFLGCLGVHNLAGLLHFGDTGQQIPRLLHLNLQLLQVGEAVGAGSLEVALVAGAPQLHWEKVGGQGGHQVSSVVPVEGDARDHPLAEERLQEGEELVEHPRVVHKVDCSEPEREAPREKVAEAAELLNPESSQVFEAEVSEVDNDDDSTDLSPRFLGDELKEKELVRVETLDRDL